MLKMPAPDAATIGRRSEIAAALRAIVPGEGVIEAPIALRAFESDGLTAYRQHPLCVALPETEAQVQQVLKVCHRLQVPVVARGAGTGLSGGAMPHADGVTLSMAKFNRIILTHA